MKKLSQVFTPEEHNELINVVKNAPPSDIETDPVLGRIIIAGPSVRISEQIVDKALKIARDYLENPNMQTGGPMFVTYSGEYGNPNLPAHFDGDTKDLIFNYQLSSNVLWPLGVDMGVYDLEDNDAMVFNANTHIHWRPHKEFKKGEYVTMMFLRFYDPENPSDYSYARYNQDDPIFDDVRRLRDALREKRAY
jgi:hypothetical protein